MLIECFLDGFSDGGRRRIEIVEIAQRASLENERSQFLRLLFIVKDVMRFLSAGVISLNVSITFLSWILLTKDKTALFAKESHYS